MKRLVAFVMLIGVMSQAQAWRRPKHYTNDVFRQIDFTQSIFPVAASCSRTGTAVALAATSASTYVQVPATTCVYEQRGVTASNWTGGSSLIVPGGWWAFPGYANRIGNPFATAGGNWLTYNLTLAAAGGVVCPDGTSGNATKLTPTVAPSPNTLTALQNFTADGDKNGVASFWLRDDVGSPPTFPMGSLNPLYVVSGYSNSTVAVGGSGGWRRNSYLNRAAATSGGGVQLLIEPSTVGGDIYNPAPGSIEICGSQVHQEKVFGAVTTDYLNAYALADLPIINGTTGSQIVSLNAPGDLVQNGEIDVSLSFVPSIFTSYDWNLGDGTGVPGMYFIGGTSADGDFSVRWTNISAGQIKLAMRGVDVFTAGVNSSFALPGSINTQTPLVSNIQKYTGAGGLPQEMTIRIWYKPVTTHQGGIEITINGATQQIDTFATAGGALAAPTQAYLLSQDATQGWLPGQLTNFTIYRNTAVNAMPTVTGVALGDSLVRSNTNVVSVPSYIWTATEINNHAHGPIAILALGGDTCTGQLTLLQGSIYHNNSTVGWFSDQCGINEFPPAYATCTGDVACTTALILADMQANITYVHAHNPSAKVLRGCITPAFAFWNAHYGATEAADLETVRQNINTAIQGGGGTPLTGVDAAVCGYLAALTDVDGKSLLGQYNIDNLSGVNGGDGLHYSDEARATIVAWAYRLVLLMLGF